MAQASTGRSLSCPGALGRRGGERRATPSPRKDDV